METFFGALIILAVLKGLHPVAFVIGLIIYGAMFIEELLKFLPRRKEKSASREDMLLAYYLDRIKYDYVPDRGVGCSVNHKSLRITFDRSFAERLSAKEKLAVIHHEIAHLIDGTALGFETTDLQTEIKCDLFAARRIGSQHMINALLKAGTPDAEVRTRIEELRKFSRSA